LFVAGATKPAYDTLVKAKAPFSRQLAYFVAGVEFVCGSLLTVGFLSSAACVALLIDMTVATLTDARPDTVQERPDGPEGTFPDGQACRR
jgi:putative oxidoreductase